MEMTSTILVKSECVTQIFKQRIMATLRKFTLVLILSIISLFSAVFLYIDASGVIERFVESRDDLSVVQRYLPNAQRITVDKIDPDKRDDALNGIKQKRKQSGNNRLKHHWKDPASKFKDDYQYCDVHNISALSQWNKEHNSMIDQLNATKIEKLKQMRTERPKACDNKRAHPSYLKKQDLYLDEEHNLVPFINRCKIKGYATQPDLFEYIGGENTDAAYMHVFKSGMNYNMIE